MSTKRTFLLVDDDADDRDLFCDALDGILTCDCYTAINGEDALDLMRNQLRELPEIIFLDLSLPRMNGWDFLRTVKEDETFKHIPVIIYSGSSSDDDREYSLNLGAIHYITKPSDFNELRNRLAAVLA
ncbi:MAG: response regulator receiver protein [Bacteroidota bacterium]|nr:response regulator receiver protein [Bacteroidota bacterium]